MEITDQKLTSTIDFYAKTYGVHPMDVISVGLANLDALRVLSTQEDGETIEVPKDIVDFSFQAVRDIRFLQALGFDQEAAKAMVKKQFEDDEAASN